MQLHNQKYALITAFCMASALIPIQVTSVTAKLTEVMTYACHTAIQQHTNAFNILPVNETINGTNTSI